MIWDLAAIVVVATVAALLASWWQVCGGDRLEDMQ